MIYIWFVDTRVIECVLQWHDPLFVYLVSLIPSISIYQLDSWSLTALVSLLAAGVCKFRVYFVPHFHYIKLGNSSSWWFNICPILEAFFFFFFKFSCHGKVFWTYDCSAEDRFPFCRFLLLLMTLSDVISFILDITVILLVLGLFLELKLN